MIDSKMKLMKLMAKKPKISDKEKEAKMSVLEEIQDTAKSALSSKLPGLKKVTVAADSEMGLKKGLEKAEDMLEGEESEEMEDMEEESGEEMSESMSEEELDAKIKELMMLKASLKK